MVCPSCLSGTVPQHTDDSDGSLNYEARYHKILIVTSPSSSLTGSIFMRQISAQKATPLPLVVGARLCTRPDRPSFPRPLPGKNTISAAPVSFRPLTACNLLPPRHHLTDLAGPGFSRHSDRPSTSRG
jgi:hypothetical protein